MSEKSEIVCIGAAGHALHILHAVEYYWKGRVRLVAMVDERENGHVHSVTGVPVISMETRAREYADVPVMLGIGNPKACERLGAQLLEEGATFARFDGNPELVHPDAKIGVGVIIAPYARIGAGVEVGNFVQVLADLVAHDVKIGAGAHIGVHSSVLGHVEVGPRCNIAPHAVICNGSPKERMRIGADATVAVGAVVSRPVPSGGVVVGNPAMSPDAWRKIKDLAEGS